MSMSDPKDPLGSDPSANVLAIVDAAVKRLDDLRSSEMDLRITEMNHIKEVMALRDAATGERQRFNEELRKAETARIDAIRAVDVGAVARAAEVSATLAQTLANQVAASAEALRNQVGSTAAASNIALAAAIEPIQKSIDDLRKTQYEQAGQRSQQVESKGSNQWIIGIIFSVMFLALSIAGFAISLATK